MFSILTYWPNKICFKVFSALGKYVLELKIDNRLFNGKYLGRSGLDLQQVPLT